MATSVNYVYVNRESISERLKCPICENPLVGPVSTNCQPEKHIFCRLCIVRSIARDQLCPVCDHQLNRKDLVIVDGNYLSDALDALQVKCKVCNETGLKRINFNDHVNNVCPKVTIACPCEDIRCPWVGQRNQLDDHLPRCIFAVLRPLLDQHQQQINAQQEQINAQQEEIEKLKSKNHKRTSELINGIKTEENN